MIVSRDGWVKRQKEVKDLATTRLREGDSVLAAFAGSTRASCVFFSNFGVAYTSRFIDVPASTGYGEPIQKQFKLKDGEKIVAAMSLDPRVVGVITAKKEGDAAPVHAVAVSSDGYALRFNLDGFVEPSTRSGRRYARPSEGAEIVNVARLSGGEMLIAASAEARGILCKADEVNFLSGPGKGVLLDQAGRRRSPARRHRVERRPRSADRRDDARGGTDDQHREIRSHRPRRQGPRAAAARPVHAGRLADARGAVSAQSGLSEGSDLMPVSGGCTWTMS